MKKDYGDIAWLKEYDRLRTNPDMPNESWISSKYDLQGLTWNEIEDLYIPELEMCWGPACSALKKSWYRFRIEGAEERGYRYRRDRFSGNAFRGETAHRINRIQDAMGIPLTEFEEYPYYRDDDMIPSSKEEMQLRKEEQDEDEMWGEWENA